MAPSRSFFKRFSTHHEAPQYPQIHPLRPSAEQARPSNNATVNHSEPSKTEAEANIPESPITQDDRSAGAVGEPIVQDFQARYLPTARDVPEPMPHEHETPIDTSMTSEPAEKHFVISSDSDDTAAPAPDISTRDINAHVPSRTRY